MSVAAPLEHAPAAAAPPPAAPAAPARERVVRRAVSPGTVLAIASLGVFMEFVDSTVVNIAFPSIREDFSTATLTTLAWIFDAYAIVFAAFLVAFGRLADLLGRKRLFLIGVTVFTFASALCALAPSAEFLIAARALQALGGAIVVPASLALVVNAFPPERRTRALTAYGSSAAIAAALGPPIGGLLIDISDWRLVFLVNLPIGVLVLVLASRKLVESRSPGRRTLPDLTGALVLALALALLTLGIVQGPGSGWASPLVIGSFLGSIAAGALFLHRSSWHHAPVVEMALLRQREFSLANLATAIAGMGFYGALLCNALYLIGVWGYSPLDAGLAFIPAALVAAVVAAVAGRVAEKSGFRVLIVPGALIYATGYLWFHERVGLTPDFLGEWLPGAVLSGIGAGLVLPQLGAAAIAAARGTKYAVAGALSTTARQLGGALGIAFVIVIIGHEPTPDTLKSGWAFVIGSFGVVALIVAMLSGLRPAQAEADGDDSAAPVSGPRVALAPQPLRPVTHATIDPTGWDFLRTLPLVADLSPRVQALLASASHPAHVTAGEYLFREGEAPDGIYAVRAGRLQVLRGGKVVTEHGRGELIGELGVLTDAPRAASVRARRDSELVKIPRAELEELLQRGPELALALSRRLAERFQAGTLAEETGTAAPVTIAFVGAGSSAALTAPGFARTLGRLGRLAVLNATQANGDRVSELDRAERTNDRVLLVADPETDGGDWTRFAMAQADRVVLSGGVVPPARLPVPVDGAELLLPDGADRRAWARALPADAEYHLSYGSHGADALARRLAGRSLGLVLGGGGARALAHVGVAEEIERSGLVVDRVGGSGLGALVAALMAMGMDAAEVDARIYDELVRRNPFGDYRPSRTSLIRGRRVREMLDRLFGDALIQELPLEFFAVSADLAAGERVVHRTGRVADAVLAAISIPGLMQPVAVDGRLLTDAGSLDNLPVGVMAARGEGPIVAVDVSERDRGPVLIEPARGSDGAALPGVRDALARAAVIGSLEAAEEARRLAAVVVAPEGEGTGLLEFHQVDELRAAGRRAARLALALRGRALEAML